MIAQVIVNIAYENIKHHSSEKLTAIQLPPDVERPHRLDYAGIRKRSLVFPPVGAKGRGIQQTMRADIVFTSPTFGSIKTLNQEDGPASDIYQLEIGGINARFVG
nr:hypothetical protein [Rugamonas rubra]